MNHNMSFVIMKSLQISKISLIIMVVIVVLEVTATRLPNTVDIAGSEKHEISNSVKGNESPPPPYHRCCAWKCDGSVCERNCDCNAFTSRTGMGIWPWLRKCRAFRSAGAKHPKCSSDEDNFF